MTEYWVSQGNKWCDFCKIYISNNPSSIRNHELGQRHKDNVAKRLASMRKENAAKEKQQKEAVLAFEQIEAKANRSYQKDVAKQEASDGHVLTVEEHREGEWEYDNASGYHYNQSNGLHFDPKSGFYYSDAIGKWVTQEEAYASIQASSNSKHKGSSLKKPMPMLVAGLKKETKLAIQNGPPPGPVVSAPLNPMRSVKGATSAVAINKRKRQDEKPKVLSPEEKAALKAREAAKKRVEEREKSLLGLYKR
ncbi:zinc finger protein ZOP1 [Euphorbia lathyris]|uniref:zinc finger protein ZOP1 n=1 Tax=Euphorbia lathyris TaxID=212925 RepID=UPI0033140797